MKVFGVVAAVLVVLAGAAAGLIWMLARRVVGVKPRRRTLTARIVGDDIELPRSELTVVPGNYGLWFGERFEHHALIGPVVSSGEHHVTRRVLKANAPFPAQAFDAQWTGHIQSGPADVDPEWEDVVVPLRDGQSAPAWLFHGTSDAAPWVIHVQGIRTSRLVTLRSVAVARSAELTSLAITCRGAGDGPPASASTLGLRESSDLADAVMYARSEGATAVYVVAWSMGAGLALELLRNDPTAFDRLALISPATNWRLIIRHAVKRAGFPGFVAALVTRALGSRLVGGLIGITAPLEFDQLEWGGDVTTRLPTLVVHSRGDDEIPIELTRTFVAAHPNVKLVETATAPHGWEANVDPEAFRSALTAWLGNSAEIEAPPS